MNGISPFVNSSLNPSTQFIFIKATVAIHRAANIKPACSLKVHLALHHLQCFIDPIKNARDKLKNKNSSNIIFISLGGFKKMKLMMDEVGGSFNNTQMQRWAFTGK